MMASSKLALMIVTVAAAIISAPALARAQNAKSAETPTLVPINSGTFAKFMKASSNFASYVKQHPDKKDLDDAEFENASDAATAICGPRPGVKAAIAAAGLTCTEWVTLTVELFKAGSAAAMIKAGQKVPPELAVSPGDIAFYNSHTADITVALQEIKATNDDSQ